MLTLKVLQQCAEQAGFDAVGAAKADYLPQDDAYLQQWLSKGCNGSMQYMERNQQKRTDPRLLLEGTRTVVVVLLNYYKTTSLPEGVPYIALSGRSQCDYHEVMQKYLRRLEELLQAKTGNTLSVSDKQHTFCDSAPILERRWAQRAGLGWIGKNHLLIHPRVRLVRTYRHPTAQRRGYALLRTACRTMWRLQPVCHPLPYWSLADTCLRRTQMPILPYYRAERTFGTTIRTHGKQTPLRLRHLPTDMPLQCPSQRNNASGTAD